MNFEEFIRPKEEPELEEETPKEAESEPGELDVQKAVVESLAADKAAQDEEINRLKADNARLRMRLDENIKLIADLEGQKAQTDFLKSQIAEKVGDVLARNTEELCRTRSPCWSATSSATTASPARRTTTCSKCFARRATGRRPREGLAAPSCLRAFSSPTSRTARSPRRGRSWRRYLARMQTWFPAWS